MANWLSLRFTAKGCSMYSYWYGLTYSCVKVLLYTWFRWVSNALYLSFRIAISRIGINCLTIK